VRRLREPWSSSSFRRLTRPLEEFARYIHASPVKRASVASVSASQALREGGTGRTAALKERLDR
jgi:hypothetical protein